MKISIFNFPKSLKIDEKIFSSKLLLALNSKVKISPLSIIFVTEKEIQKLNKEYRNIDQPTDVLSFNYDSKDLLGEVYVCLDYVKRTNNDENEIYRVIIHGILHLCGWDHEKEFIDLSVENVENMFVVQESILDNLMKELR